MTTTPSSPPTDSTPPDASAEPATTEVPQTKKSEKRYEPQSVDDLLGAFYRGKVKTISDSTVRRLKTVGLYLQPSQRGELRRIAIESDETLDRTRRLMVVASEIPDLKTLGHLLMEFASEVVVFHPRLQRNGLQARLFPMRWDDNDLAAAWEFLNEPAVASETSSKIQPPGPEGAPQPEAGADNSKPKAAASDRAAVSKVRRNALLCSLLWRVSRGAPFTEAMRGLRNSVFKLSSWPPALERDLLEAVALMQEKEDSKVALLLEWQARQNSELQAKIDQANRQLAATQEQIRPIESARDEALARCLELEALLADARGKKEQLTATLGVVQTHGKADFEELRSLALRLVIDTARKLEEASTALGREQPKVVLARETINVAVDGLHAGLKKLEEAE